jgi:hypothetical protein
MLEIGNLPIKDQERVLEMTEPSFKDFAGDREVLFRVYKNQITCAGRSKGHQAGSGYPILDRMALAIESNPKREGA